MVGDSTNGSSRPSPSNRRPRVWRTFHGRAALRVLAIVVPCHDHTIRARVKRLLSPVRGVFLYGRGERRCYSESGRTRRSLPEHRRAMWMPPLSLKRFLSMRRALILDSSVDGGMIPTRAG